MRLSTLKKQLSEYPTLPRTWTGTQTFAGEVRFTESEWVGFGDEVNPRCLVVESADGEYGVPMIQFRGKSGQTAGYIEFNAEYDENTGDSVRGNAIAHSGSNGNGKFQINQWDRTATSQTTKAVFTSRVNGAGAVLIGLYSAPPVERAAAITKPSGGGTVDAEARTALNAVIDALQGIGITF